MTTITITGKKPGKTDVTISSTVNPAVKTIVPVTVKSRNLLAYGPASAYGLTATVNSDGSLHVTGTASRQRADRRVLSPQLRAANLEGRNADHHHFHQYHGRGR